MENIIEKAKNYAINCHRNTNHLYDGKPYETHLNMVFNEALNFIGLIKEVDGFDSNINNFLAAAWVHDVIEDCRETYNDVLKATNKEVADLAYALTNEKGKNRKERASDKYYEDMKNVPHAVLLKICDRIANVKYSISTNSRMLKVYIDENTNFCESLYQAKYATAFNVLNHLINHYDKEY